MDCPGCCGGRLCREWKWEHCSHCIPLEPSPWDLPSSQNNPELLVLLLVSLWRANAQSSPAVLRADPSWSCRVPRAARSSGRCPARPTITGPRGGFAAGSGAAVPSQCWGLLWGWLGSGGSSPGRDSSAGPPSGGCRGQGQPGALCEHKSHRRSPSEAGKRSNNLLQIIYLMHLTLFVFYFPARVSRLPQMCSFLRPTWLLSLEAFSPHREGSRAVSSLLCRINPWQIPGVGAEAQQV